MGGLTFTLGASELFARGLTRLGTKVGFTEGLLGLLGALGADSPELSSAVLAILAGAGSVGVGVVIGSNLFNLAALLGLSSLVAHGLKVRRGPLLLDATVGVGLMLLCVLMLAGLASPRVIAIIIVPVCTAYVFVLSSSRSRLARIGPLATAVPVNLVEIPYDQAHDRPAAAHRSWLPVLLLPLALAGVVGGSFVMVHEALAAAPALHMSNAVLGTVVLAALTSLPNLWVALHFARTDRGTALFSAAINSNSINLIGGLVVPALFIGIATAHGSLPYFSWLVVLTMLAVAAPLRAERLSWLAGALVIAIYAVFVALLVIGR